MYYAYFKALSFASITKPNLVAREIATYIRVKLERLNLVNDLLEAEGPPLEPPDVTMFYVWACSSCSALYQPLYSDRPRPGSPSASYVTHYDRDFESWRYNGEMYEHKCKGADAQAGHFPCYPLGFAAMTAIRDIQRVKIDSVQVLPPVNYVKFADSYEGLESAPLIPVGELPADCVLAVAGLPQLVDFLLSYMVGKNYPQALPKGASLRGFKISADGTFKPFAELDPSAVGFDERVTKFRQSLSVDFQIEKSELATTEQGRAFLNFLEGGFEHEGGPVVDINALNVLEIKDPGKLEAIRRVYDALGPDSGEIDGGESEK
jgi:hypothetical protein